MERAAARQRAAIMNLQQLQSNIEQMDEWKAVAIANVAKRKLAQHDAEAMIAKIERACAQRISELIGQL